jgi:hypothetical protein
MNTLRTSMLIAAVFAAAPFAGGFAQTSTTPDGTEWMDFVAPGTQAAGPPQTYPYQPLWLGGPGTGGMCANGTISSDGAWYAVCKCYGVDGCFVTYQSIATYVCPENADWSGSKTFKVVTATGRTKKQCGKKGILRTVEIYKTLAPPKEEEKYTWDPGTIKNETIYPGDSEITKLDTDPRKVEEKKEEKTEGGSKTETKTETTPETKSQKDVKIETGQPRKTSTGNSDKRPKKKAAQKNDKTISQTQTPSSDAGVPIGIGIGLGVGLGMGMHRGGEDLHGDSGNRR